MSVVRGNKRCFFNCEKSPRHYPNLKLYRFSKNINRARQWILKSGISID